MQFNTNHDPLYGVVEQVTPLVKRITANNPSKFTFKGTGTYIVGTDSVAVIDPGPKDDAHIEALLDALKDVTVSHILITHTHRDHSPAAKALKENLGGVLCGFGPHPKEVTEKPSPKSDELESKESNKVEGASSEDSEDTEESGDLDFMPERFLAHGEILVGKDWTIECLYTPGHISNHLCFALREESSIFTGDHIMGWSTSIIPPPDGRLDDYMDSLRLLMDRDEETYWPTHGDRIANPKQYTQALYEHRGNRSSQILDSLKGDSTKDIKSIVDIVYEGYPEELKKPAAQSVWAHLIYLHKKGLVHCDGDPKKDAQYFI